jgi:hemolysin type calcium-binding protein
MNNHTTRVVTGAIALVLLGLAAAPSAFAARAYVSGTRLIYQGATGEANDVAVKGIPSVGLTPAKIQFYDSHPISVGTGCANPAGNPKSAICASRAVEVFLGDLDDRARSNLAFQPQTYYGGSGSDTIDGSPRGDVIDGGEGHNWLSGGDGSDRLIAGGGADILIGGPQPDVFQAGAGNDWVETNDGTRDTAIDCGAGLEDVLFASPTTDALDLTVARNCEVPYPF